jgi:hypothetical protein
MLYNYLGIVQLYLLLQVAIDNINLFLTKDFATDTEVSSEYTVSGKLLLENYLYLLLIVNVIDKYKY